MKIDYNDILNFLDENPSINDVSEKLFQLGHENEIINRNHLDIEITPNRGDCLSVRGISRDLGAFYGFNNNMELYDKNINEIELDFINSSKENCPKISFLVIDISKVPQKYEEFLENYFKVFQSKKNNFFTDISNYVAYEMGQPIHCYDFKTINKTICLEKLSEGSKFKTLIGQEIKIDKNDLVFKCNKEIINLAGVMGGANTSCTKSTKSVLVESAYFKPESIVGKSLKYNLNSDAAYKFERNIDSTMQEISLRRFLHIVSLHTNITNVSMYSENNLNTNNNMFEFDSSKINDILGLNVKDHEFINILERIGFVFKDNQIHVPPYRNDVTNHNDLAEEIARIYGYNNLPRIKHTSYDKKKNKNSYKNYADGIRNYFVGKGFTEVINFPFTEDVNNLKIDNPIDVNMPYMRTSTKNSLIKNMLFNERRQKEIIKIFEITEIYSFNKKLNILESEKKIGILISGRKSKNFLDFSKNLNVDYLKELISELKMTIDETDIIEVERSTIASKLKRKIYFFETKLDNFKDCILNHNPKVIDFKSCIKVQKISDFPSSARDLSILINKESKIKDLEDKILSYKSDNLKESYIFDFFNNPKNEQIKIGVRFIFQSLDKTLTEKEIELEIKKIIEIIYSVGDTEIPGLN